MLFKSEKSEEEKSKLAGEDVHEEHSGVIDTYKLLWKIAWLPAVFEYIIILLTCKVIQHLLFCDISKSTSGI